MRVKSYAVVRLNWTVTHLWRSTKVLIPTKNVLSRIRHGDSALQNHYISSSALPNSRDRLLRRSTYRIYEVKRNMAVVSQLPMSQSKRELCRHLNMPDEIYTLMAVSFSPCSRLPLRYRLSYLCFRFARVYRGRSLAALPTPCSWRNNLWVERNGQPL